jgi:hypothetical protein
MCQHSSLKPFWQARRLHYQACSEFVDMPVDMVNGHMLCVIQLPKARVWLGLGWGDYVWAGSVFLLNLVNLDQQ